MQSKKLPFKVLKAGMLADNMLDPKGTFAVIEWHTPQQIAGGVAIAKETRGVARGSRTDDGKRNVVVLTPHIDPKSKVWQDGDIVVTSYDYIKVIGRTNFRKK